MSNNSNSNLVGRKKVELELVRLSGTFASLRVLTPPPVYYIRYRDGREAENRRQEKAKGKKVWR